jgi:hypothetical protein
MLTEEYSAGPTGTLYRVVLAGGICTSWHDSLTEAWLEAFEEGLPWFV